MAKGISLHIGLNKVDDSHYVGVSPNEPWNGALLGCENDANAMEALARENGFATHTFTTEQANRNNVITCIRDIAKDLDPGDTFFFTFSGHGGQVADFSGDEMLDMDIPDKKKDKRDETLCLFDMQLIDDELFRLFASFKEDVRILMFSDSCHSGTVTKAIGNHIPKPPPGLAFRLVPRAALSNTYLKHREDYDKLQSDKGSHPPIKASVLLFSGCQDDQLSQEDQVHAPPHGFFTLAVMDAWKNSSFNNYNRFFHEINQRIKGEQNPNKFFFGKKNVGFLSGKPLFIG